MATSVTVTLFLGALLAAVLPSGSLVLSTTESDLPETATTLASDAVPAAADRVSPASPVIADSSKKGKLNSGGNESSRVRLRETAGTQPASIPATGVAVTVSETAPSTITSVANGQAVSGSEKIVSGPATTVKAATRSQPAISSAAAPLKEDEPILMIQSNRQQSAPWKVPEATTALTEASTVSEQLSDTVSTTTVPPMKRRTEPPFDVSGSSTMASTTVTEQNEGQETMVPTTAKVESLSVSGTISTGEPSSPSQVNSKKILSLPLTMESPVHGNSPARNSSPNVTDATSPWGRNAGPGIDGMTSSGGVSRGARNESATMPLGAKFVLKASGLTSNADPDDAGRYGEEYSRLPFVEIRGEMAQIIVLSRLRLGPKCSEQDTRKVSLAEVMRWAVERTNSHGDAISSQSDALRESRSHLSFSPRSGNTFGISVYDTCGERADSCVTVAMEAIAREARLRLRSQGTISAFPLGFIVEEDDEDTLRPLLTSFGYPYVSKLDWDVVETLRGAAHLLMTWGRFPPIILLTQDPRALPVFADAANSYGLCLRASVLFPHVDDCRLRNPLTELKSYYAADTAGRGSGRFLDEPASSVWVVYGSQAFVTRCAAKYWGVTAVTDVENLLIAGRHPSEASSAKEFIPVVRLTQTTPPKFPQLSNGVFEKIFHPGSPSVVHDGLTSTVAPQNPEFIDDLIAPSRSKRSSAVHSYSNGLSSYLEGPTFGEGSSGAGGAAEGNDVATVVSSILAVIRKLEGAGRHHCWDQQAPSDPAGTDVRSHFPPIAESSSGKEEGRPGFVIGSPMMRKKPTGPTSTQAVLARKCREYIDSVARLDPKLFDLTDKSSSKLTPMPAKTSNGTETPSKSAPFAIQPAKYRFSVLRKRQGTTEWEDFAQYSSRDLTLFGEKVQYILGLPSFNAPKFSRDGRAVQAGCLNYELAKKSETDDDDAGPFAHPVLALRLATWSSVCLTTVVVGVLCCLAFLAFFYYRMCVRSISEPHYGFPLILLFSVMCLYVSVIPFILEASELVCKFRLFATGIGYAFPFSAMLARQAMIAAATSSSGADHISGFIQLMLCAFALGIQCCVAVETWLLKPSGLTFTWNPHLGHVPECDHKPDDILVSAIYVAFLLLCLILVGPAAAKKKRNFREGLHLCLVSWGLVCVWASWSTLIMQFPDWTRVVISAGMTASATLILVGIFAPKICYLMTYTTSFRKAVKHSNNIGLHQKVVHHHHNHRNASSVPNSSDKYARDDEITIPEDGSQSGELVHATNLAVLNRAFAPDAEANGNASGRPGGYRGSISSSQATGGSRVRNHRLGRADSVETSGTMLSSATTARASVPRIAELDPSELAYGYAIEDDPPVRSEHLRRAEQSDRQNSVSVGRVLKI